MSFDLNYATSLIENTRLPQISPSHVVLGAASTSQPSSTAVDLSAARDQALVVGSDVVSFTAAVDPGLRQAIVDSSQFAQLAANQQMPGQDPIAWFDRYFSILGTLGWIVQKRETAKWEYKGDEFGVHEAIIGVVTAFLAPIPGAAAAVIAVLNGLHKMNADAPFITLFRRESTHGEIGRFQLTYVHQDAGEGAITAEAAAFALNADAKIDQLLFFKLHKDKSTLRRSTGTLAVDPGAMRDLKDKLAAKLSQARSRFVADADLGI